jgi:hypothetical protein
MQPTPAGATTPTRDNRYRLSAVLAAIVLLSLGCTSSEGTPRGGAPEPSADGSAVPVWDGEHPFGDKGPACDARDGLRFCESTTFDSRVHSFDGVPLDVALILPAETRGPLPLIIELGGWASTKDDYDTGGPLTLFTQTSEEWARLGYAVLSYTSRGFGASCGSEESRQADPEGCERGWVRLADSRYEVRDTQHLADERVIDPAKIGVIGVTYGGAQALQLAVLRDRVRVQDADRASYQPWVSPGGVRLQVAAVAPILPYGDLLSILAPNGQSLDYERTDPAGAHNPIGVLKPTVATGLYLLGLQEGVFYAPPGVDPDADLANWNELFDAGEPYGPAALDVAERITRDHSALSLDSTTVPAPVLTSSGWADEILPADESIRVANKIRSEHPDATVAEIYLDIGHRRSLVPSISDEDRVILRDAQIAWFARYLHGDDQVEVPRGIVAKTQACPGADTETFRAETWAVLVPGEVSFDDPGGRTVSSTAGTPSELGGSGEHPSCVGGLADGTDGTATYRHPVRKPFTLLGAPTIVANLELGATASADAQLVARLWDIDPAGQPVLVARGVYRPIDTTQQVFQLHPNGYRFNEGHDVVLELLGRDQTWFRPSNSAFEITVSSLHVQLPVAETPDYDVIEAPLVRPGQVLVPADT